VRKMHNPTRGLVGVSELSHTSEHATTWRKLGTGKNEIPPYSESKRSDHNLLKRIEETNMVILIYKLV
jgi:hypothetical protein